MKAIGISKLILIFQVFLFFFLLQEGLQEKNDTFISKPTGAELAQRQDEKLVRNPFTGEIPLGNISRALQTSKKLRRHSTQDGARVAQSQWEERGPNNIAGRCKAVMFDPNDPQNKRVWVGSVSGGLWFNNDITDQNSSWRKVNDLWSVLSISSITYDPSNTSHFYLGTGEGTRMSTAVKGNGIFKSEDGGASWLPLTVTENNPSFYNIRDIVVTSSGVVIASTQRRNSNVDGGIFRSADGGMTWQHVLGDEGSDIEIMPNGDILCAAKTQNGSFFKLFKSSSISAGALGSWVEITPPNSGPVALDRVEIATTMDDPQIIYAMGGSSLVSWIEKSTDGGSSWTNLSIPLLRDLNACGNGSYSFAYTQAWHNLVLKVHPDDKDYLLIGGIDLFRSTNGGASWEPLSIWSGPCFPNVHADQQNAVFRPSSTNEVVFLNDGGVYYSPNAGNRLTTQPSFTAHNSDLNVTQLYSADLVNASGSQKLIGGSQDNGTLQITGSGISNAATVSGGDGGFAHIDEVDSNLQITSYVFENYRVSTNGGQSFSTITSNGRDGSFINPTDFDSQQKILYGNLGSDKLDRIFSIDQSPVRNSVSVDLGGGIITHVVVSPFTPNRIFVGTDKGELFMIDEANQTPVVLNISTELPYRGMDVSVSSIAFGLDDSHLLASFSNYGINSVWETLNGGRDWVDRSGDLPHIPIRWVVFDPGDLGEALAATEVGVWVTENLHTSNPNWVPVNSNGLANVKTMMLKIRQADSLLLIATHGRGFFESNVFQVADPLPSPPQFYFTDSEIAVEESNVSEGVGGPNRYQDVAIFLRSDEAVNGDAQVRISITGDALENGDYELLTPSQFTVADGQILNHQITIRIFDDKEPENQESVSIAASIDNLVNTNASIDGTRSRVELKITDNDDCLDCDVLWSENWSSPNPSNYGFEFGNSQTFWDVQDYCSSDGAALITFSGAQTCTYTNTAGGSSIRIYRSSNGVGYKNGRIEFDWQFSGNASDNFQVIYSTDGSNWQTLSSYFGSSTLKNEVVFLPASSYDNSFYVGFQFTENGDAVIDSSVGLAIDNIEVKAEPLFEAATMLHTSSIEYLGPNATVNFVDDQGREIAKIENLSGHDYGFTTISIDAQGTSSRELWNAGVEYGIASKSWMVSPSQNSPNGHYRITFYLSQAEMAGWLNGVNANTNSVTRLASDMEIAKSGGTLNTINPMMQNAHGYTNYLSSNEVVSIVDGIYQVIGEFDTGFSGFGVGTPGDPPSNPLPVELINFSAELKDQLTLKWQTLSELNNDYFQVQRSLDGMAFRSIATVKGAGNSTSPKSYSYVDQVYENQVIYYRLKQVDFDGAFEFSNILSVDGARDLSRPFQVFPTISSEKLFIHSNMEGQHLVQVLGLDGKVVHQEIMEGKSPLELDIINLKAGTYVLRIIGQGQSRFVKK